MFGASIVKTKELARLRNIEESLNTILRQKDEEVERLKIQAEIWKRVSERTGLRARKAAGRKVAECTKDPAL
jgi:hypothetical protein